MIDNRTASAIDLALQKYETPVGPLFVAVRHGRVKKCFSRDTAIRYLAFFMATEAFERSDFRQRYPDTPVNDPELGSVNQRGRTTLSYLSAHRRCVRRLRRILARKRDMQKWCERWDSMHDRFVKEVDALQSSKPQGMR